MYVNIIKQLIEEFAQQYAANHEMDENDVLEAIRTHIDDTTDRFRRGDTDINYPDALCRLGYLYRQAIANATLFEKVIRSSEELRDTIRSSEDDILKVCSMGGGPGTELLGLAKYLIFRTRFIPRKISFTIWDSVPYWAETWDRMSELVESSFSEAFDDGTPPVVSDKFVNLNVFEPEGYTDFGFYLNTANIIVFNYIFSENQDNEAMVAESLQVIRERAQEGCAFVVIDRAENSGALQTYVRTVLEHAGFPTPIELSDVTGTIDTDEQVTEMGEVLTNYLGIPRVKFFTDMRRNPTVFSFVSVKH